LSEIPVDDDNDIVSSTTSSSTGATFRSKQTEKIKKPTAQTDPEVVVDDSPYPCIIMMDSLGCHNPRDIGNQLRAYVIHEWESKRNNQEPLGGAAKRTALQFFGERKRRASGLQPDQPSDHVFLPLVIPAVPKQTNAVDCGVFLLCYVNQFLKDIAPISKGRLYNGVTKAVVDASVKTRGGANASASSSHRIGGAHWFKNLEVRQTRDHMRRLAVQYFKNHAFLRQESMPKRGNRFAMSPARDESAATAEMEDDARAIAESLQPAKLDGDKMASSVAADSATAAELSLEADMQFAQRLAECEEDVTEPTVQPPTRKKRKVDRASSAVSLSE
jgi:hypothetical protein